ncbi:efflux RND transporter periplasmic adaptor subunit [Rhodobacteraceae bacterium NNCM2]|nr:efflux RND transporter periplasmic adaptor subunit [Coraliihabitans acroporae]
MRLGPLLLTVILIAGLAYWFVFRDPAQQESVTAMLTGEHPAAEETPANPVATDTPVPAAEQLRPVSVMVLDSEVEETVSKLIVRGRTEANRNVNAPAETTGIVISQPLRRGSEVKAGQVLCELAPGTRPAQLLEAQAKLAQARVDFDAASKLSERGFTAETTRMSRAADLETAQAAVELIEWDISKLKITSPFDGVLESDTAELGARLAPGEPCANVIDLSIIKVTGYIGEQNIDAIRLGQTAVARLINGTEGTGRITFISRVADADTRTYLVEVTLDNRDGKLRDGMTTESMIDLPPQSAHLVPQAALTLDDDGALGLRIAEGDTSRFVEVGILRDEERGVWVTGLPDKARIIVVGQEFVRDGRAIRSVPITWDDLG